MARLPRPTPPRGLIFLASGWLVVAWVMSMGLRPPIQMHAASYTPSVRMLLLSVVVGIAIGWPLVRLSGSLRAWPIRQTLLDLLVLVCLAQVVVWPLRLVTPWPPVRSLAIDLLLIGWSLAIAAVVATGSIPARRGLGLLRSAAMVAIVLLVLGAPLLTVMGGRSLPFTARPVGDEPAEWWDRAALSPATAIDALSGGGPTPPIEAEWRLVRWAWWTAGGLWLAAALIRPLVRRVDEDPADDAPSDAEGSPDAGPNASLNPSPQLGPQRGPQRGPQPGGEPSPALRHAPDAQAASPPSEAPESRSGE